MKSSIQYEKSKRITTHPLRDVFAERTKNRLKRKSPNHIAREVAKEHKDITGCIPEQLVHHTKTLPQDLHPNVEICKEIAGIGRKGEQSAPVLRTNTLDLIDEKYNNAEWTHVYTDGSATEAVKDGGSGIFIKFASGNLKRISIPAGHTCSNYKAELLAIQTALDSLEDLELNKRNIVLFTDSLSALQGLDSDRDDLTLQKIKQSLSKLGEERNIVLQWIPAHCGIPGNEEAAKLAKIGSETIEDQPSSLTYAEVKTKWNNDWKKNHSDYSMGKDAMHSMEREQQKTIFLLRTGHGCLRAHLHKQGKTDSPYCNC